MRKIIGAAGIAALALAASACASSSTTSSSAPAPAAAAAGSSSAPASSGGGSGTTLDAATVNGVQVLTNSKGMVLYWFVPDTSTASKCTSQACTTAWPPVTGPATAGSGVTGQLGTITRSDGTTQATYDGHPLYTFEGDSAPDQAKGNGLNASGGVWWEMEVSGATPAAPAPAATHSTSGGGGYGY